MPDKQKTTTPPFMDPSVMLPVEPVKIFDDLYFVGNKVIGILILRTCEGLVLFDATGDVDAYDVFLAPGLEKLGLSNEKILVDLITHGHFDHYLGAPQIHDRTGCPIGMSMEDTAYMSWSRENIAPGRPTVLPRIDIILKDGQELIYGEHKIHVMVAGGHTPGCVNFSFDAHENGATHRVVIAGGYGIFGPGRYPESEYPYGLQWAVDEAFHFASACVRFWEYCKANNCEVYFNPHPHLCDFFKYAEANKNRNEGEPNAFVIGLEGVRKYIAERFSACIESVSAFSDIEQEYKA